MSTCSNNNNMTKVRKDQIRHKKARHHGLEKSIVFFFRNIILHSILAIGSPDDFTKHRNRCTNFEDFKNCSNSIQSDEKIRSAPRSVKLNEVKQTYIMIKPDGTQRGLIGEIIGRFERKRLRLRAIKLCEPARPMFEVHYQHLSSKPFSQEMIDYMQSGPVCCMIWEGHEAIVNARKVIKASPGELTAGIIRGNYYLHMEQSDFVQNVCHGSDSEESAAR